MKRLSAIEDLPIHVLAAYDLYRSVFAPYEDETVVAPSLADDLRARTLVSALHCVGALTSLQFLLVEEARDQVQGE